MKTQREIEDLKQAIQGKITETSIKANEAYQNSEQQVFEMWDREYAKLIAQYNILCLVLG